MWRRSDGGSDRTAVYKQRWAVPAPAPSCRGRRVVLITSRPLSRQGVLFILLGRLNYPFTSSLSRGAKRGNKRSRYCRETQHATPDSPRVAEFIPGAATPLISRCGSDDRWFLPLVMWRRKDVPGGRRITSAPQAATPGPIPIKCERLHDAATDPTQLWFVE
ncbi:hypothetical protein E2C01_016688 [Portunus trituberculatus]|uniref:Uncharacterized protein n=1 Tax=Portunus trituberculatus TaxID=210409 RepID=A0A5B7DRD7_PORTR|nr:hypothetical protein [Portunus trituberculatus]